jgi:hypothetical protein
LLLAAPGRDHVQRRLFGSRIERPAQHLAVNGDDTDVLILIVARPPSPAR